MARLPLRHPDEQGGNAGPHNAIVSIAETPESFIKLSVLLMAKCRMVVERHRCDCHTRGDRRSYDSRERREIIFSFSPKARSLPFVVLSLPLLVIGLRLSKFFLGWNCTRAESCDCHAVGEQNQENDQTNPGSHMIQGTAPRP